MSKENDMLERIRMAQVLAGELAAIEGRDIHTAQVMAGEAVVMQNLNEMMKKLEEDDRTKK